MWFEMLSCKKKDIHIEDECASCIEGLCWIA